MIRFSILAVAVFLSFFPVFAQKGDLLWAKATSWGGEVRVRQLGDTRILLFADKDGETEESRMSLSQPNKPQSRYVNQMLWSALWWSRQRPSDAPSPSFFVVGLGGGGLSKALAANFPDGTVVSADIEPAVLEAAKKFFFYKESERVLTVIDDARRFLESSPQKYDLIYLDAFDDEGVPAGLRTVEFAELLDQHLNPGGAVVANVHFVPEEPSLRYQRSLTEVFPQRYLTAGVAQGVGIFSHAPIFPPAGVAGGPSDLDLSLLLAPAPLRSLDGVEPYRDGPE
jgi:SAM-dependent methyltransferase